MPVPPGTKFRYKRGTHTRLAIHDGDVVEAKNTETGEEHTMAEFAADRKRRAGKKRRGVSARRTAKALRGR